MTTSVGVGVAWVDPGAIAVDDVDGVVSQRIVASASSYVDTRAPTVDPSSPTGEPRSRPLKPHCRPLKPNR